MRADTALAAETLPSPNHDERPADGGVEILLLHYTGMRSAEEALARLVDPAAAVSSHYVVEESGRIVQLVPEARRAWHAGEGSWEGRGNVNARSVGIEIVNPGHEHGYRPFPAEQMAAVAELCRDCVARWAIRPQYVLAHSDTAPKRKKDPGELFPWDQLFAAGIGHWVPPTPMRGGRFLQRGDRGKPVDAWQEMLRRYGYHVEDAAEYGVATMEATIAFQRHFRPERVDGVADVSTVETLYRLLAAL